MTPNGAPETGPSTAVNVLDPVTAGQFMAYTRIVGSQASGTYWIPPAAAGSTGMGMGPSATSNSPGGLGGARGGSMSASALFMIGMASPQLPVRAKGAGCPAPGSLTGK